MAGIVSRSNIPALLFPGLKQVFTETDIYGDQWKAIYKTYSTDRAVEYDMEIQSLGIAKEKGDGAPVAMGTLKQAFQTKYVMRNYGIGFQITNNAIQDNQYKAQFPQQALALRNSLQTLKNVNAMYLFNQAFNAESMVSDGQPLCSTSHPIPATGETIPNTFDIPVSLNQAALEDAITAIKGFKNAAGLPLNTNPVRLMVPQGLAFQGSRLLNSQYSPGTANNDINVIYHDRLFSGGLFVNNFLTDPNNWFIITDADPSFKHYVRQKEKFDFITDIVTDNVTVRVTERWAFGCSNWRGVFGSGASAV